MDVMKLATKAGLRFQRHGDKLLITGPRRAMTPALWQAIRRHKWDIMAALERQERCGRVNRLPVSRLPSVLDSVPAEARRMARWN